MRKVFLRHVSPNRNIESTGETELGSAEEQPGKG